MVEMICIWLFKIAVYKSPAYPQLIIVDKSVLAVIHDDKIDILKKIHTDNYNDQENKEIGNRPDIEKSIKKMQEYVRIDRRGFGNN